jgi:hypothetical protein
MTASA